MDGLGVALMLGAAVVVPLGLRLVELADAPRATHLLQLARLVSLPAAGALVGALLIPAGPAAGVLVVPWLIVGLAAASAATVGQLERGLALRPDVRHASSAALLFLAVAPVFAMADRLGLKPFGLDATIIRLTAIHFVFAGFALPLVGAFAWTVRPNRLLELALGAVIVGIPLTALGFVGLPAVNWLGALAVAAGGFGIGLAGLRIAPLLDDRRASALITLAGGALLLSMPLAVAFASGTLVGAGWLDITAMARIHGTLNALGFAIPALLAMTLEARRPAVVGRYPLGWARR